MMWKWIGMRIGEDKSCGVIALLLLTMAATAIAQDTRQVTEPKIPAVVRTACRRSFAR